MKSLVEKIFSGLMIMVLTVGTAIFIVSLQGCETLKKMHDEIHEVDEDYHKKMGEHEKPSE